MTINEYIEKELYCLKNQIKMSKINRKLEIDDIVYFGFIDCKYKIIKKINENIYLITSSLNKTFENYKRMNEEDIFDDELLLVAWHSIFRLNKTKNTTFSQNNKTLDENTPIFVPLKILINKQYEKKGGYNFDASYQRDFVWSNKEKMKLIDSIFKKNDIGMIVISHNKKSYDIFSGKQRIKTILDFFEDRLKYKGHYYSELSIEDKRNFQNYNVKVLQITKRMCLSEKFKYCLEINSKGIPVNDIFLKKLNTEYQKNI